MVEVDHTMDVATPCHSSSKSSPSAPTLDLEDDSPLSKLSPRGKLKNVLAATLSERDSLLRVQPYFESTISELLRQNRQLEESLIATQELLLRQRIQVGTKSSTICSSTTKNNEASTTTGSTWLGGSWLCLGEDEWLLGPAENAWANSRTQDALNLLTTAINKDELQASDRMKAELLLGVILRGCGQVMKDLSHIEEALYGAQKTRMHQWIGRAHYHRGLCWLYLEQYANASWCFTLATHTEGHRSQIEVNRLHAEKKRTTLDRLDSARFVSQHLL